MTALDKIKHLLASSVFFGFIGIVIGFYTLNKPKHQLAKYK